MWPLVCLLVGGVAFAARRGVRYAALIQQQRASNATLKQGGGGGEQGGIGGGFSAGGGGADQFKAMRDWAEQKFGGLGTKWKDFSRDLRGFENPMTKAEAYQILRLTPAATKEKILQTHKQLMLRNHPDNGGSTYVATKVNEAKDHLLKK